MSRPTEQCRAVVVTGLPRGGTSVIGKLVALADGAWEVYEPFNPSWGLVGIGRAFPWLRPDDDEPETRALLGYLRDDPSAAWRNGSGPEPDLRRSAPRRLPADASVAVLKDPYLLCALEWVTAEISDVPTIVTVRHPAAWMASLNRRRMSPEAILKALARQESLASGPLNDVLQPWFDGAISNRIDAIGAAWTALVTMVEVQIAAGAQACVLPMEQFSQHPLEQMTQIYELLRLQPPDDLTRRIAEFTEADTVVPPADVMHEHRRDSAALASAWRDILPVDEVQELRAACGAVAHRYYPEW